MEGINQKYNLEIEVLTPLSIGAGSEKDWVRGVDFVVDKGQLYKLNLKKMIANGFKVEELTSYYASKDEVGLKSKLARMLDVCSDFSIPFPAECDNDVKTFVKNQLTGNPVLPGSSLKGSIRSVLFHRLGGKTKDGKEVFGSSTEGDEYMRFIKISDAEFDKTELVNTKIFNLRGRGNNWQGGWKFSGDRTDSRYQSTGFNTLYESLMPEEKGFASLMMSDKTFHNFGIESFYNKKKGDLQQQLKRERNPQKQEKIQKSIKDIERLLETVELKENAIKIENLFAIINQHTKDYLEKERGFFEKYATDRTVEIINSIDSLLGLIPSDNSYCILKMSAGSGFHSITGDWQFDDFTKAPLDRKRNKEGKVNPKSRKIVEWNGNLSLMGFVKLRNLCDEELHAAKTKLLSEKKRKEEELKAKQEAEEKLRKEKEERKVQFDNAISEIECLMSNEKYEEAYAKYNFVIGNYPEFNQHKIDVNYLKSCVDYILSEQEREKEAARQEQERLQSQKDKAEGGLAKLLNEKYEFGPNEGKYKIGAFKICAQKVTSWMKAANVDTLPEVQHQALHETVLRLAMNHDKKELKSWNDFNSSIWTQLSTFVGHDTASAWFLEITGNSAPEN